MAEQVPPRRARLGAKLKELRARSYPSGSAFAKAIEGWGQSKVSKLERGAQLPTDEDLDIWVQAAGASAADREELAELLSAARLSYRTWATNWRSARSINAVDEEIAALERKATVIREYQPSLIPGLAATRAYRRASLSAPGGPKLLGATPETIEAKVSGAAQRQEVLYEGGRRIQLLVGEAALYIQFDEDASILRGQLRRLADMVEEGLVEVGILPFDRPSPVLPLANFSLLDDSAAVVETTTGEQLLLDADEVAVYVRKFEIAWAAAVTGEEAVARLRR